MKRFVSLILVICMVLSILPLSALAVNGGTEEDGLPLEATVPTEPEAELPTEATVPTEATEPEEVSPTDDPSAVEPDVFEPEANLTPAEETPLADDVVASGTCGGEDDGSNLMWTLDSDGLLTILGEGAMAKYSYDYYNRNYAPWYSHRSSIQAVCISAGVTTIGDDAFYYCNKLTSVTIPDSVTTIGDSAFSSCYKLTSVTIPDSVTTIGDYAFRACDSLTSVTIPDSVTTIGNYAFSGCDSLTSVTIPDSVTTIGDDAFSYCYYLTSVTILPGVTTIGDSAFSSCYKLTSVTIPDSVTTIGDDAFYHCSSLTSVTIPDSVTTIGDSAFSYCDSLTAITVDPQNPSYCSDDVGALFDKEQTTLIQFPAGSSCTTYSIPDSVTTIGNSAFYHCSSLTSVTIPDSVTTIGDHAFYYCDSLTSVTIPDGVTTIGDDAFSSCYKLASVTIPDSVTTIGDHAFSSCDSLTSVTIPDSVTTIGDDAFSSCDKLTSVTIPDSVTTIGDSAFSNCYKLTSVTIPDSVTTIGDHAFSYCDSLTAITVDPQNPSYCSDDVGALFDKAQATLIQFPAGSSCTAYTIPKSVTTIGDSAFYYCDSLTSVTLPDSVTTIGDSAFYYCYRLASITIPDSVTTIGDSVFYGCNSLTSVTLPEGLTSINDSTFENCGFTSITIPDSVTYIGSHAFSYCDLTSITIPEGVTYIGSYAFSCCHHLFSVLSVTFEGAAPSIGDNAFYDTTATVRYPNLESSWTSSVMEQYGGTLTWESYTPTNRGSCGLYGSNLTWRLSKSGTLTISGSGKMADYTNTGAPWPGSATTLVLGKNVTGIGNRAFAFCYDLETIVLEDGNSSFRLIDGVLFNSDGTELLLYPQNKADTVYCVPNGVTTLAGYAFYSCNNLTELTLPKSLHTIEDYALGDLPPIRVYFSGDAPSIAEKAFSNSGYHISYYNVVTCYYYGSQTNWPTSKLKNYDGLLCWVDADNAATDELTVVASGYLDYSGQWKLTSDGVLTIENTGSIPDFSDSATGYWYPYMDQITHIRILSNYSVSIGKNAFRNFTALKTVEFPIKGVSPVSAYAFAGCDSLEKVIFPASSNSITIEEGAFYGCSSLKTVGYPVYTKIGSNAFAGCTSLEEIYFTNGVSSISVSGNYAENTFTGVTATVKYPAGISLYAPDATAFGGTLTWEPTPYGYCTNDIQWAYDSDTGTLTLSGKGELPEYVSGSFTPWTAKNSEISKAVVEEGITTLPSYTFEYASSLSSVSLPNTLCELAPNAFNNCSSLNNLLIPRSVIYFKTENFNRCPALTDLYYEGTWEDWRNVENGSYAITTGMTVHKLVLKSSAATCTQPGLEAHYRFDDYSKPGAYLDLYDLDKQKSNSLKNDPPIPHLFDTYVYNEDATCLADGTETALCDYDCGTADVRQAEGTMLAHLFTVYNENGDATCLADSTETALCDYGCGTVDTRTVPDTMLEHLFTQYVSDGNATCLADGTKTALCDYGCGVTQQLLDEGSMLAHTPVTDEAKTPTCTETGLTEGSHCATCPTVFVAQTVLPATGHDEVCDAAKAPTCTETGLTEGFHCGVCDIVLVEQTLLPAKGHAEVIDAAKAPTCTETGLTEGKHCDVCDTVLTAQTILPAAGHTDVIDAAKAPTCTETGLTEGVHCSVCNTVLTAQTQIPANGHTEVIDEAKAPTCTETGLTEGVHCSVCSTVLTAQTQIPANGHTEVTDGAKAPTCTETGLTEGVHCSVCNAVLTAQTEVPANGHTNATPVTEITTPATCTLPGVQDTVVFCTVCSLELSRVSAELPATGHTEDPALRVSGLGYDTCTCAICGETYVVWQDARLQYITLSGMTDLTLQDDSYPWIYNSDLNRFESGNYRVNSSSSGFTLTFTLPTNALVSFDYGVSSESGFDNLSVSDTCGGLTVSLVNPISGTQSGSYSGVLTPGEHRLTFSYSKDGSVNTGSDLGWFSDLRITVCTHPEYTVVTTPPTCTQVGGTVYTCTACGHAYPGEEIPAAGHLWSEPDADFFRICKTCSVSEQVTSISGTTTDGLNWELTATGTLTVSGSGNCTDGSAWAAYTNRITSFVAASGITGVFEEVLWDLSLTSVTLSETVTDLAVEALSANSEDLAQITVHADNPAYSASGNVLFNKAQTALLLYPAGKTDSVYSIPATVLCIDDYAFRNCQRLTALFLPAKLEQLGNRCFDGCTGLQNIVLDSSNGYFTCDRNTALIRKEDGALVLYCAGSLQSSYTVPNGVTYIASFAFADAANLKTLSLPLSLDEIESSAFVRCKSLASVTYPGTEAYWNHSVTVSTRSNTALTEAAFTFGTVDTLSGTCGDHLTWTLELTPGLLTISGKGDMAFTTVSGLLGHVSAPWPATAVRSVVIQEGITSLCDMAFEHCTALTDVSLPATLTELGRFAFEGCSSLTSITIPENITSIPRSAFENCTALTDVTIPESVTTIEYDAFFSCPIATMHYTGSEPRWGLVTLADGNTSLLIAEHVFNSYLLAEWNSSHTVLSLSEKVDDSAYVVAAFYAPDGQMVLAKHYTADEVQSGVGISSSAINLKTCTAKIMVLDENYAPLGVPYTPDIQKYVYRKAWLYATEHAYIDGGRLADAGTLLFSDGRTVTTVNTDVCDLGIWDLGQEYFLTIDPTTGEVVSVRLSGGSTSGTSSLYNLDWRRVKDDLNTWYSFTIGGVEGMFAGNLIPCLYLTPDGNGIPTTMASKDLYNIAGNAVADLYHVVDKDNDGEIDYLLVQPCLYAKITETGVHKTYGPYMELTDASGNELLFDGNSRWYIADNTDLKGSPEEGDFLKLSWNPEKGIYETDILDPKSAVFEKRTTAKGTYTFGDTRYTAADDRWITDEQLAELILGTYYTIVTDGELLLSVDAVTIVPLDAATMFTDGADIDEKAKNGVELLCTLKVMKAYADNSYKPNGIITRAEVAAILYRICTGDVKDEYADLWVGIFNCTDVDDGDWYAGYVGYCFSNCIIRGDSDGTFRPHDPITTTEAARWLLAAIGYDGDALGYYGPEWEQNVLRDAVNTRLLENYLHSTSGATTRQWLAVMLENMLTKAYTIDTVVPGDPSADVYILMGEKYFGLTKDSLIYRLVYSL